MAVKTVNQDVRFQGLSSDPMPSGPNGATFHVIDTGEVYVCHDGVWTVDLRMATAIRQATVFPTMK